VYLSSDHVTRLADGELVILDGVLGPDAVETRRLAGELAEQVRPAGTSRQGVLGSARQDAIRWLDPPDLPVLSRFFDALRSELNERLWLALSHTELQLARYLAGAHYSRHLDAFADQQDRRLVTAIYYLNDWHAGDGGELRAAGVDVEPILDRVVIFRSELVEHEVLPTHVPRFAVTAWYR
jgi:SM-20-related protein